MGAKVGRLKGSGVVLTGVSVGAPIGAVVNGFMGADVGRLTGTIVGGLICADVGRLTGAGVWNDDRQWSWRINRRRYGRVDRS